MPPRPPLRPPVALALVAAALGPSAGPAEDWPHWRGPARDGVSHESDWHPVGREAPLWERDVGIGHSSCAVAGGAVYTLGFAPGAQDPGLGEDALVKLDLETGALLWRAVWPGERRDNSHDGGTLSTPAVAHGRVFVTSNVGRVAAYDALDGRLLWAVDAQADLGLGPPTWGFAASPVVLEDAQDGASTVVVSLGAVVAFDAATGAVRWRTAAHYGSAYSTPTPFEAGAERLLAVLAGDGLAVVRAADGAERAFHRWDQAPRVAPMSPVVAGDRLFVSAGYDRGALLLRYAEGALTPLWASRVMRNKMSGCVLVGRHLYGFDEALLRCVDLDGAVAWTHRGLGTGAVSAAGGRLVLLDGKGQLVVATATPTGYVELSRRALFDEGTAWSPPVLADGRVLCRSSLGRLVCLDHRRGPDRASEAGRDALARLREALPSADELFARHRLAAGRGAAAPVGLASARLVGAARSMRNSARRGTTAVTWAAGLGFKWREYAATTDAARGAAAAGLAAEADLELGWDARGGWEVGEREVAERLEGDALEALREAGDVARLVDPAPWYPRRAVRGVALFDHRPCFVVAAATAAGRPRTLYFDAATGLLAGQEAPGVGLWTYDDHAPCGPVLLPRRWAHYDEDKGELTSARFDEVALDVELGAEDFAPPPVAALFFRAPEALAEADAALRARFAELLGDWIADSDPPDGPRRRFWVADGFLQTDRPRPGANRWRGPDERGRMVLVGAEYLTFGLERDAAGRLVALQVYTDDEPRTRLVRPR